MSETPVPEQNEAHTDARRSRILHWWPFLLGPLGMLYVYFLDALGSADLAGRQPNELVAMPIIGLASFIFWIAAIRERSEFHLLLAVLTLGFFFREWHFEGTSTGVYIVALACVAWAILRRDHLAPAYYQGNTRYWLMAALATYVLSQLIARRVFAARYLDLLPNEEALHIALEETVENVAHLMMLVTSMVAWPRKKRSATPGAWET